MLPARSTATGVTVAALAVSAVPAAAQVDLVSPHESSDPSLPSRAGSGSRLVVDFDPSRGAPAGRLPQSLTVALARGVRFRPRAARACPSAQADRNECPESTRIGRGHIEVNFSGYLRPGDNFDSISRIDAFLARPFQAGDVAGIYFRLTELSSDRRSSFTARVVRVGVGGRFGLELRIVGLPSTEPPFGIQADFKRLALVLRARRRIRVRRVVRRRVRTRRGTRIRRRRVVRRVRVRLFRNPRSCAGSWPYELRVGFADGTRTTAGRMNCRRRR
jgi:hypothetical protein